MDPTETPYLPSVTTTITTTKTQKDPSLSSAPATPQEPPCPGQESSASSHRIRGGDSCLLATATSRLVFSVSIHRLLSVPVPGSWSSARHAASTHPDSSTQNNDEHTIQHLQICTQYRALTCAIPVPDSVATQSTQSPVRLSRHPPKYILKHCPLSPGSTVSRSPVSRKDILHILTLATGQSYLLSDF